MAAKRVRAALTRVGDEGKRLGWPPRLCLLTLRQQLRRHAARLGRIDVATPGLLPAHRSRGCASVPPDPMPLILCDRAHIALTVPLR
jgi:hypothetical protein